MRTQQDASASLILLALVGGLLLVAFVIVTLSRVLAPVFANKSVITPENINTAVAPGAVTASQTQSLMALPSPVVTMRESVENSLQAQASPEAPSPQVIVGQIRADSSGSPLRAKPTMQAEVLAQLEALTNLQILGRTQDGDWYKIRSVSGQEGWLPAQSVQLSIATVTPAPSGVEQPQLAIMTSVAPQTPQPLQPSVNSRPVQVYETVVSLPTYGYADALVQTQASDPIYPYPRLDFTRVGPPQPKTYKVVVLESEGAAIVIAPELGGRVLRWFDKRLQREVLYSNTVLKPVQNWGFRGWWMAVGGIEIAFPAGEHGALDASPWAYNLSQDDRSARVRVCNHEVRTELDICVTWLLHDDDRLLVIPQISNRTGTARLFQFWLNIMLPHSPNARFDLPTNGQVIVHSTGDATLPKAEQAMTWPHYNGRDFSIATTWQHYLGLFANQVTGETASITNPDTSNRMTLRFDANPNKGLKLFLLGDLPTDLYTDDGRRYMELWSGITRTFNEDALIQPGQTLQWTEELTSQKWDVKP